MCQADRDQRGGANRVLTWSGSNLDEVEKGWIKCGGCRAERRQHRRQLGDQHPLHVPLLGCRGAEQSATATHAVHREHPRVQAAFGKSAADVHPMQVTVASFRGLAIGDLRESKLGV